MDDMWIDIPGYEGMYEISSYGVVRSKPRYVEIPGQGKRFLSGKIISLSEENGYKVFNVWKENKCKNFSVHRLVISLFNPVPNMDSLQVNHKDCNRFNNRLDNLEWVTPKQNIRHCILHGNLNNRENSSYRDISRNGKSVKCLNDEKTFVSMKAAAENYGLTLDNVSQSIKKNRPVKGYQFVLNEVFLTEPSSLNDPNTSEGHAASPVYCFQTDCIYPSRNQAAKSLGISVSSVVDSLRDGKPHRGYTFKNAY